MKKVSPHEGTSELISLSDHDRDKILVPATRWAGTPQQPLASIPTSHLGQLAKQQGTRRYHSRAMLPLSKPWLRNSPVA